MNLSVLEKQKETLLLKKSKGEATAEDLKQLARILNLINMVEPSVVSEMRGQFMKKDDSEDLDFTKK